MACNLQKGKLLYIEGKLRTRSFEDKQGHKKYNTEIVAENFTMFGRKSDSEAENSGQKTEEENSTVNSQETAKEDQPMNDRKSAEDDDLPF